MILIIACGNELREDDGAGLLLAERLEQAWLASGLAVRRIAVQQLVPELAAEIASANVDAVVFVDTRVAGGSLGDGAVTCVKVGCAGAAHTSVGHHADPAILLAYAGLLMPTDKPPPAWLVTVPGVAFGHGQGLSASARAAIDDILDNEQCDLLELARTFRDPD
jgi:hydrogenase maturation protease